MKSKNLQMQEIKSEKAGNFSLYGKRKSYSVSDH